MSWLEVIGTANFIVLCIIAIGVFRASHAVASMHSGLAQALGRQEETAKKILWQFDSGLPDEGKPLRHFPLHILVHTLLEDFRSFKNKWYMLHIKEFAEMEIRSKGTKAIYEELKADFPDVFSDDPVFNKLFGDEDDKIELSLLLLMDNAGKPSRAYPANARCLKQQPSPNVAKKISGTGLIRANGIATADGKTKPSGTATGRTTSLLTGRNSCAALMMAKNI